MRGSLSAIGGIGRDGRHMRNGGSMERKVGTAEES